MFRRLPNSLPEDPIFPHNLKELGYYINEDDRAVNINYPDETFLFKVTNNERHNQVRGEVYHACLRQIVLDRLQKIGVQQLFLPQLMSTRPDGPHVSILTTQQAELCRKKRIVVIANYFQESLGIWSSQELIRGLGINQGSIIAFIKETSAQFDEAGMEAPGFIVLNPGEMLYSHEYNRTMSSNAWDALPRPSACHPPRQIHSTHNMVPGHVTSSAHVKTCFEAVIMDPRFVSPDADLYVIGCGEDVTEYFGDQWPKWKGRVSAMALIQPHLSPYDWAKGEYEDLVSYYTFLAQRSRAWVISDHPVNTPLHNADDEHLCPVLSAGVDSADWTTIMPRAHQIVSEWFTEVALDEATYSNPVFDIKVQPVLEVQEPDWGF